MKRFTMDTIWQAAYGVDIDVQNKHDNFYFTQCEKLVAEGFTKIHYFASIFCIFFISLKNTKIP